MHHDSSKFPNAEINIHDCFTLHERLQQEHSLEARHLLHIIFDQKLGHFERKVIILQRLSRVRIDQPRHLRKQYHVVKTVLEVQILIVELLLELLLDELFPGH